MAYKRWYDFDQKLSAIVAAMEFMNRDTQIKFGQKMLELSEQLLMERGGTEYLQTLEEEKKVALGKSNSKRRWYDQHESLHRAFNNLYALSNKDRRDIASQLFTPILIVQGYEKQCKQNEQTPDLKVIEEVLRTSLFDGEARARKLYGLYLYDYAAQVQALNQEAEKVLKNGEDEEAGFWTVLLTSLQRALNVA